MTTHEDRIDWLRRCLAGEPDTLADRVAASLLLLYALPITRVAALHREQISTTPAGTTILLGDEPADVPSPFAELLHEHLADPPHRRGASTVWVLPGVRAGEHLHPNTVLIRLRDLGIDLRGTRNAVLRDLVQQVPAPIVASQLGYSPDTIQRHADAASQPLEGYAGLLPAGAERCC